MRALLFALLMGISVAAMAQNPVAENTLPCSAKKNKNAPKIFWGFWNPKPAQTTDPAKQVSATISFSKPDASVAGLDCVGQPLELNVPNGQQVLLNLNYDPNECKTSSTTVSKTKATSDSPIPDILSIAVKIGAVGFEGGGHSYLLAPEANKIVTIDATCTIDKEAGRKATQSVKITYQNPPRVGVSSGLLLAHGVDSYGIKTTLTGVGATGTVNSENTIAITASPAAQVIPFGFVNIYYAGSRVFNFNGQVGIGVNPNLSSAKVEFFGSPFAIGVHDFYISPGFHVGQHEQIAGGFVLGQTTPNGFTLPRNWQYYTGFGISLSYNLKPLAKAGSTK